LDLDKGEAKRDDIERREIITAAHEREKKQTPGCALTLLLEMLLPRDIQASSIAYFSMEVGLDPAMPTYSGGLGILAGDTLRAAADLGLPMIGVTLLHRKGYFRQNIDPDGNQHESPAIWNFDGGSKATWKG
jgi:glucan phosphorylase